MSRQLLILALPVPLLFACPTADRSGPPDAEEATPFDWGYELDEDVETYLPDDYVAEEPARVVFLGDSITAGVGASQGSLAYPALLEENDDGTWDGWGDHDLRSVYGADFDVVDVAQGGAVTDDLVDRQLPALSAQLGDSVSGQTVVIMTIGGNDMQAAILPLLQANDQDAEADRIIGGVADNMHETLDYFDDSERFPDGTFVYFANVYEPSDAVGQSDRCFFGIDYSTIMRYFVQANGTMRDIAEERGAAMVDMRGHFLGHGMYNEDEDNDAYDDDDPSRWFESDCQHPNDRGHHEIRRLFVTAAEGRPLEAFGEAP